MELSREDERPDILMSAKDKDGINKFSRHLARRNELKSRIERRKKLLQLHDDAADELILMDDDAAVHYTVGDVFIVDDKEHIEETLEKTKAELSKDIEEYEDEQKTLHEEMTALKASLYAKFGKVSSEFVVSILFLLTFMHCADLCLFRWLPSVDNKFGRIDLYSNRVSSIEQLAVLCGSQVVLRTSAAKTMLPWVELAQREPLSRQEQMGIRGIGIWSSRRSHPSLLAA